MRYLPSADAGYGWRRLEDLYTSPGLKHLDQQVLQITVTGRSDGVALGAHLRLIAPLSVSAASSFPGKSKRISGLFVAAVFSFGAHQRWKCSHRLTAPCRVMS